MFPMFTFSSIHPTSCSLREALPPRHSRRWRGCPWRPPSRLRCHSGSRDAGRPHNPRAGRSAHSHLAATAPPATTNLWHYTSSVCVMAGTRSYDISWAKCYIEKILMLNKNKSHQMNEFRDLRHGPVFQRRQGQFVNHFAGNPRGTIRSICNLKASVVVMQIRLAVVWVSHRRVRTMKLCSQK